MVHRERLTEPSSTDELLILSNELRELQREREKRSRAKTDLLTYASSIDIPGAPLRDTVDDSDDIVVVRSAFGAHHLLWIDCLQKVEDGKIKRLMGLFPPGCGKSVYSSIVFPTHYMGRFPRHNAIVASYGSDLPTKFGRRARSIVKQPIFKRIFNTQLSDESSAADGWTLTNGSEWMAAGILTGITGNRVDLVIWDDLIKGREQADSDVIRNKTWDAYMDDLLTRKKPGAAEIGINCMVGSTIVSMADGSTKFLKDLLIGDKILSYLNGKIVSSRVLNWANKGPDNVFTIKTKSGRRVTANERHPFLVEVNGKVQWLRLKDLSVGHRVLKVIGVSGKGLNARSVTGQLKPVGSVMNTTVNGAGRRGSDPLQAILQRTETVIYGTVTASISKIMKLWSKLRVAFAQFAENHRGSMILNLGAENFALTTATLPERSVAYFATTAITSSGNGLQNPSCLLLQSMYETIPDEIISIEPAGYEDVFDIQVEYTENFIADGLVSHNTRWHEDDPAGRILPVNYAGETGWVKGRDGNDWYVVCLPAQCESLDDPLGRKIGEYIWPEWFPPDHFAPFKRNSRTWSSLFQQRPAPESGDYFQADWLKPYGEGEQVKMPSRDALRIYGASDYAVSKGKNDYTVHVVVGVDDQDRLYLLDLWRKQESSDVWVESFCDLVQKWKPIGWAEESGQIASSVGPLINKRLRERRLFLARKSFPSRKDKEVRAQSIRGRMAMNGLFVPKNEPWYPDFKNELMVFSNGNHDDQVDAMSLVGQILDLMMPGEGERPEAEKPKVFSMEPGECTVTLTDLWEANDRKSKKGRSIRIA
jgi:predicted phage terminase large subunit-like protein